MTLDRAVVLLNDVVEVLDLPRFNLCVVHLVVVFGCCAAKSATIDALRIFKDSFAMRRGILPVRTFNVGEEVSKKVIQHVLTPRDGKPLGIAVIWDTVPYRDGVLIKAFVMVTTEPNMLIGTVTDRMPAILPPEQWGLWLGEIHSPLSEVKALLVPYPGELDMTLQPKAPTRPRGGPHAPGPML